MALFQQPAMPSRENPDKSFKIDDQFGIIVFQIPGNKRRQLIPNRSLFQPKRSSIASPAIRTVERRIWSICVSALRLSNEVGLKLIDRFFPVDALIFGADISIPSIPDDQQDGLALSRHFRPLPWTSRKRCDPEACSFSSGEKAASPEGAQR